MGINIYISDGVFSGEEDIYPTNRFVKVFGVHHSEILLKHRNFLLSRLFQGQSVYMNNHNKNALDQKALVCTYEYTNWLCSKSFFLL